MQSELYSVLQKSEYFEKFQNKCTSNEKFKKLFFQKYTLFFEKFMMNEENESQKSDWIELAITSLSQCYIYSMEQNKFYSSLTLLPQSDDSIIFHLRDILLESDTSSSTSLSSSSTTTSLTTTTTTATTIKQNSLLHIWKSVKSVLKSKCIWNNFRLPFMIRKKCNERFFSFFESTKDAQFFMYSIGLIVKNKDFDFTIVSDSDTPHTHPFLRFIQGVLYKYLSKKSIYHLKIVTGWKDHYVSNFNSVYYLGLQRNIQSCENTINEILNKEEELAILISCINLYEEISCSGDFESYFHSCLLKNAFTRNENTNDDCNFENFQERVLISYMNKVSLVNEDSKSNILNSKFMKLKDIQNDLNEFLQEMHIPTKLISTEILKAFLMKNNIRPYKYSYYLVHTPVNHKHSYDENRITVFLKKSMNVEWKNQNDNSSMGTNVVKLNEKDIKSMSKILYEKESNSDSELDFVPVRVLELFFQKYIDSIISELETFNGAVTNENDQMEVYVTLL